MSPSVLAADLQEYLQLNYTWFLVDLESLLGEKVFPSFFFTVHWHSLKQAYYLRVEREFRRRSGDISGRFQRIDEGSNTP